MKESTMELTEAGIRRSKEFYKEFIELWKGRIFKTKEELYRYIEEEEEVDQEFVDETICPACHFVNYLVGTQSLRCRFCPIDWSYTGEKITTCGDPNSRYIRWQEAVYEGMLTKANEIAKEIIEKTIWKGVNDKDAKAKD